MFTLCCTECNFICDRSRLKYKKLSSSEITAPNETFHVNYIKPMLFAVCTRVSQMKTLDILYLVIY